MTEGTYPSPDVDAWGTGTELAPSEAGGLESAQLIVGALETLRLELAGIRAAAEAQQAASEAMRQLSEQLIEEAGEQDETPSPPLDPLPEPDFHPFQELPAGTIARDLPDGGRLFLLPDGLILRVGADRRIVAIDADGQSGAVEPGPGGVVTVAPGRAFTLDPTFLRLTHEAAGISGLPIDVEPVLSAPGRVSVQLPDGIRLEAHQKSRLLTIVNPTGTINIIGGTRIEAIGERVETHLIADALRSFAFAESGHAGVVEADGAIQIGLGNGLDLIVNFPVGEGADDTPPPDIPFCVSCGNKHS